MKKLMFTLFALCIVLNGNLLKAQDSLLAFIHNEALSPDEYIIEKFRTNDVVLLGEHHLIKQNLLFVQDLIPKLYKHGIRNLGMEFGAQEVQDKLDSLVNAPEYDQDLAQEIMFTYNCTWGYQEYVDIYKAAWRLNRSLPQDAPKFRILNLSYIFRWDKFTPGPRNPENVAAVFTRGTVDKFRAEIIEQEVLQKGEKVLALVGTTHAFTKYGSPYFKYNGDNFCDYDHDWLGGRLYRKYPGRVFNIMLHQAFNKREGDSYIQISPLEGILEKIMALNGNKPVGFDLLDSPMGRQPDPSIYSTCYKDFTLGQLFDGYIFLKPLSQLEGCTPIKGFVNEQNIEEALRQFPDPDWHAPVKNLEDMVRFIDENPRSMIRGYNSL